MEKQLTPIPVKRRQVLTSVKVDEINFNNFKVECVHDKYTFTKLANSCMELYLQDENFKNFILNYSK